MVHGWRKSYDQLLKLIFFLFCIHVLILFLGEPESSESNSRSERSHLVVWQVPLIQESNFLDDDWYESLTHYEKKNHPHPTLIVLYKT